MTLTGPVQFSYFSWGQSPLDPPLDLPLTKSQLKEKKKLISLGLTKSPPPTLSLRCVTQIQSIALLKLECQETTEVKRARKQDT